MAIGGGTAASFQYDAQGRRTSKAINTTQSGFLYDGLTSVQELNGTTVVANLLTGLGIDEYLMRTDATGASHYLADALSSIIALTDSTGAVPTSYTYAPFGATDVTGSTTGNAFDYTGREDDGTGLKYYRARYYHPGLQRFISEDPIEFGGGDVNLYVYVRGAPLTLRDPLGLDPAGAHDRCSYGSWEHFGEPGWMRVFATREFTQGSPLIGQRTASGHVIQADDIFVALPSRTALGRLVQLEYGSAGILAPVLDVGPHSIDDPYWIGGKRPRAEFGQRTPSLRARYGRPRNPAGIDLSDQAFRELGMRDNAYVWWRFYPPDSLGGRKGKGGCQ